MSEDDLRRAMLALNSAKGSYLLALEADERTRVPVGRLGELRVTPGVYLYAGSAFGPGGVRARVLRHLDTGRPARWHVDYLRAVTRPVMVRVCIGENREHEWAAELLAHSRARMALPRFGASDCRCPTHLVRFRRLPRSLPGTLAWRAARELSPGGSA